MRSELPRAARRIALSLTVLALAGCNGPPWTPAEPAASGSDAAPADASPADGGAQDIVFAPVDLQAQANESQLEMTGIPPGVHQLADVDFQIGENLLQLGSKSFVKFPQQITDIPVGRSFRRLHALHATQGGAYRGQNHPKHEDEGVLVGRYVLNYQDGTQAALPVVYGEDLREWWNWDLSWPVSRGKLAWTGDNAKAARYKLKIRLYVSSWQNPHPDKPVETIDYVSANAKAAPFCVAITTDDSTAAADELPSPAVSDTPSAS